MFIETTNICSTSEGLGSRYIDEEGPEYYYRLHAGQDIGSTVSGKHIEGVPVRSTINGTFLDVEEVTIETGDGYAIRYRHMPPESYAKYKIGDKITVNDVVGSVGGYSCNPWGCKKNAFSPHLHYEILKGEIILIKGTKQPLLNNIKKLPKYLYNKVLDPSKVTIRGGEIHEQ